MQTLKDKENFASTVQDDAVDCVNGSGTSGQIDTPQTQWCSPTVRHGMIYFIKAGAAIKIGHSATPEARLGMLQVGSQHALELLGVMHGSREAESKLHMQFADLHIRGEWFQGAPLLIEFIDRHAQAVEPRPQPEPLPPPPPPIKRMGPSLEALAVIGSLIRLRESHGSNTAIGHCCSNIVEQIKEMANYIRPEWAKDDRQTLPWMLNRSMSRLAQLRASLN